jgi:imidazolonepropionase
VSVPVAASSERGGGHLNVVHAAALTQVTDAGVRRGRDQDELNVIRDGALAIRNGLIVGVGTTADVLAEHGTDVPTIDATGKTVMPGLVECHSHPIFDGERHDEYAERLAGASLADVAAKGGGIWRSVVATRSASDHLLLDRLRVAYDRILRGGVTTLEVKSGYGLTTTEELRGLKLLELSRDFTPMELVISFLGAHVVPRDLDADADHRSAAYTDLIDTEMLPAVVAQGLAQFHDITVEDGFFTPEQGRQLMSRSDEVGLPIRVHADAWKPSLGWRTAVAGRAVSADHLTYTSDEEIISVGRADTVAVLLPIAELIYMTDRRANARLFIEQGVPVAISTDYCSSIHATSLLNTLGNAAPWFQMTPAEVIVGATLNAAYSLGLESKVGSLDIGKRGDLLVLDCVHPEEICLALGAPLLDSVVIAGRSVL